MDLQAYLDKGLTNSDIAKELGVSRQAVHQRLKRNGIDYRAIVKQRHQQKREEQLSKKSTRQSKQDEQLQLIVDLGKQGFSFAQIAVALGLTKRSVEARCIRNNIHLMDLR